MPEKRLYKCPRCRRRTLTVSHDGRIEKCWSCDYYKEKKLEHDLLCQKCGGVLEITPLGTRKRCVVCGAETESSITVNMHEKADKVFSARAPNGMFLLTRGVSGGEKCPKCGEDAFIGMLDHEVKCCSSCKHTEALSPWSTMGCAPRDGTEVLLKLDDGGFAIAHWRPRSTNVSASADGVSSDGEWCMRWGTELLVVKGEPVAWRSLESLDFG